MITGRPVAEDDEEPDSVKNVSSMHGDEYNNWPVEQIIQNDRFDAPIEAVEDDSRRFNVSTIFNDRLGEIDDEQDWLVNTSTDDVIKPGRTSIYEEEVDEEDLPTNGAIRPGRPSMYDTGDTIENVIKPGRPSMYDHDDQHADDIIKPGRPSMYGEDDQSVDDLIKPGRPESYHHQMLDPDGNKVSLGLDDLISNGRPPTILLGTSDYEDDDIGNSGGHDHFNHHDHHGYITHTDNVEPDLDQDDQDEPDPPEGYNHGFHTYHTINLLYKNKTSTIHDSNDESKKDQTTSKPKLPSYYPQLASHYDEAEDSELTKLRPNFTQTLQSFIASKYPHYGQHHHLQDNKRPSSTKRPMTNKRTTTTRKPTTGATRPTSMHTYKPTSEVDRFGADILDPKPGKNNLSGKKPSASNDDKNVDISSANKVIVYNTFGHLF